MRGRLIFPFLAELARLDTVKTETNADAAALGLTGYDDDFREPVVYESTGGERTDARKELPSIFVPAQIEPNVFEQLKQMMLGDSPDSRILLTFHFADLERLGLVDSSTGLPLIRRNDRLVAIRDNCTCALVQSVPTPPGLYVVEALPTAFGIGGARNLLVVTFNERELSVTA